MMTTIIFKIKSNMIKCKSRKTKTAEFILKKLPISGKISTWGEEIYFDTPLKEVKLEKDAKDVMKLGEIAFWNDGNAIAIGFGRTPASTRDEIRLVSPCNVWADAIDPKDLLKLREAKSGDKIEVLIEK